MSNYKGIRGQPLNNLDANKNKEITSNRNGDENEKKKKCETCGNIITESKKIYCSECCEYVGCDECWVDNEVSICGECEERWCITCDKVSLCDGCGELLCEECADFKPGKGGIRQCHSCQPWWQKNRSACDFCVGCGSSRQNAHFCEDCGERYCDECPGFLCGECDEVFKCEGCNDFKFCETKEISICTENCGGYCSCDNCKKDYPDDDFDDIKRRIYK